MPSLTDGAIRHAIKRVEKSRKQMTLADGEGRGTGRLVLILKPMPTRVTAEWMAQQWRDGHARNRRSAAYPAMSLSRGARDFQARLCRRHPERRSIKIAGDARPGTVADLFEGYVKHLKDAGKSSWPEAEKGLNKIADTLGRNRLARDITPDDVLGVIRPIYERGNRAMADHVRSYIRSAYSWAIKSEHDYRNTSPRRFKLVSNPAAGIPTEPKVVGTRWLDEDEFVRLYRWLECPDAPVHPPYTRAVRILMLTGQRVEEIARLHVDQWDAKERIIDWSKTKNGKPHAIPVPPLAAELIECINAERIRLVLPFRDGPVRAGQSRHALQLHVAPARTRRHPVCDEPRPSAHLEDAGRQGRRVEGNPRPHPESRASGRELEELRSLELHARKARRHGEVGQVRHCLAAKKWT